MKIRGRLSEENIWVHFGKEQEPEGKAIVQEMGVIPPTLLEGPASTGK